VIRRWGLVGLVAVLLAGAGAGLYAIRLARGQTPLNITGPNILPNNDFAANVDAQTDMPDGWTRAADGVRLTSAVEGADGRCFLFREGDGCSVYVQGIGNWIRSPLVDARPGASYRVAFRALADSDAATRARVFFHWLDDEGTEFRVDKGEWYAVPARSWSLVTSSATAPAGAYRLAISIHPGSDDPIVVAELSVGQLGVRVAPWPDGKAAALAFSFDYETAMGGLVHGRSVGDLYADQDYLDRARRMREGAERALSLFAPHAIRATFYANGYNFLLGNTERRPFMGDPVYEWANTQNGWLSDKWKTEPWFSRDPYQSEEQAPEWYFGSQIGVLQQAEQDIQSHTFAHFSGNYVSAGDWRADFAAWRQVAAEQGVEPATSLAFPWSSSAGLSYESWRVLRENGIRSITRTANSPSQRRSWIADRERWTLRQLPGQEITVVADSYLTPDSRAQVLADMQVALLNEGAIDVWAHTEEVTSPEQIEAWRAAIDAAADSFWIAPVPEIVSWANDVREVTVQVQTEGPTALPSRPGQPEYRFIVRNGAPRELRGVTLTLPLAVSEAIVDGSAVAVDGHTLILDLAAGQAVSVALAAPHPPTPSPTRGEGEYVEPKFPSPFMGEGIGVRAQWRA